MVKVICDGVGEWFIGVCGEVVGDFLLVLVFVGVGICLFLMVVGKIIVVKVVLFCYNLE